MLWHDIVRILCFLCLAVIVQVGDTVITHREPNPDEARVQAMSVIAACAKGLMYFQSEVKPA